MSETTLKALKNAAASSAMEGLPLSDNDISTITNILDGKLSLSDFLQSLKQPELEI